jgi:hypothetical protein
MNTALTWFVVIMVHTANCQNCPSQPYPLTIQVPDQATCEAIKKANSDQPLECWGKSK